MYACMSLSICVYVCRYTGMYLCTYVHMYVVQAACMYICSGLKFMVQLFCIEDG